MYHRSERSGRRLTSALMIALFAFFIGTAFVLPLAPTARATTFNVTIADFTFSPATLNVQIGDTVVWTNNGPSQHTVTSDGGAGPLNSALLNVAQTYSYTFTADGTYAYHCSVHPSMTADVVVGTVIPEYSSVAFVALGLMVILLGLVAVGRRQ